MRPGAPLLLVALGGRSLAGTGILSRSLVLPGSRGLTLGQTSFELRTHLGGEGSHMLQHLGFSLAEWDATKEKFIRQRRCTMYLKNNDLIISIGIICRMLS
jgi:hypothetical protein